MKYRDLHRDSAQIKLGHVTNNVDGRSAGNIQVELVDSGDVVDVKYSTPVKYSSGGFIAIPKETSLVVIMKPANSDDWVYLSTVVDSSQEIESQTIKETELTDPVAYFGQTDPYSHTISPDSIGIYNRDGNGIEISSKRNDEDDERFVSVKGATDHRFLISDNGQNDSIGIYNNNGFDKLKFTGDQYEGLIGPESAELNVTNNIDFTSLQGSIHVCLDGGRRIDIFNRSRKDVMKDSDNDNACGQINIESFHNDIVLRVNAEDSRILLVAEGEDSIVQVRTNGSVNVNAEKDINVRSGQNINIAATGDVNIEGATINLNPGSVSTPPAELTNDEERALSNG